jgi:hypothetical protein
MNDGVRDNLGYAGGGIVEEEYETSFVNDMIHEVRQSQSLELFPNEMRQGGNSVIKEETLSRSNGCQTTLDSILSPALEQYVTPDMDVQACNTCYVISESLPNIHETQGSGLTSQLLSITTSITSQFSTENEWVVVSDLGSPENDSQSIPRNYGPPYSKAFLTCFAGAWISVDHIMGEGSSYWKNPVLTSKDFHHRADDGEE